MVNALLNCVSLLVFQILNIKGCPDPLTSIHIYDGPVYLHPNGNHGYQISQPGAQQNTPDQSNSGYQACIPGYTNIPDSQNIAPGCQLIYPGQQTTFNEYVAGMYPSIPGNQNCPNTGNCQNCPLGGYMPECTCGCKTTNSLPINTACQQYCPGYGQQTPWYQYPPNVYTQNCSPGKECTSELLTPNKVLYSKVVDGDIISFTYDIGENEG